MRVGTIKKLLVKYRQLILYGIFGGLTTLINVFAYYLLANILFVNYLIANAVAWVVGVGFAYITNKTLVFESHRSTAKEVFAECAAFFGSRLSTGVLDMFLMYLFVSVIAMNGVAAKVIDNVVVIVANYVLSKFWIFK